MQMISKAIVAVKHEGKLLLLKRSKMSAEKSKAGLWEFPTGEFKQKFNSDMNDVAFRVLRESTNLSAEKIKFLGNFIRADENKIFVIYAYAAVKLEGGIKLSAEHESYKWATKKEILSMPIVGVDTLTLLKLHKDFL